LRLCVVAAFASLRCGSFCVFALWPLLRLCVALWQLDLLWMMYSWQSIFEMD